MIKLKKEFKWLNKASKYLDKVAILTENKREKHTKKEDIEFCSKILKNIKNIQIFIFDGNIFNHINGEKKK